MKRISFFICMLLLVLFCTDAQAKDVIESQIDGEFKGFEYDNVYKLTNGQIWVQIEQRYYYYYSYMPRVMIFESDSYYYMKVDGVQGAVAVQQLR